MEIPENCIKNGDSSERYNSLFVLSFLFMQIQIKLCKKGNGKRTENKICSCKLFFQIKISMEEALFTLPLTSHHWSSVKNEYLLDMLI